MDASAITVHWHNDNQPIYSVDIQPNFLGAQAVATTYNNNKKIEASTTYNNNKIEASTFSRLVTAGGDNNVRIWQITKANKSIEYLATLSKHSQAVNCVRYNPRGDILATAGDDGTLFLWKMSDSLEKNSFIEDDEEHDDAKESWSVVCTIRSSTSEIMDLAWDPRGKYIASGSMDNQMRIYRIEQLEQKKVHAILVKEFNDHSHYIQGVSWDPLGKYLASQSADRSMNVYEISKLEKNNSNDNEHELSFQLMHKFQKFQNSSIYHSETLPSFFRRLCFSPDGAMLVTPAGLEENTPASTAGATSAAAATTSAAATAATTSATATSATTSAAAATSATTSATTSASSSSSLEESSSETTDSVSTKNSIYIYSRTRISTSPIIKLCGLTKPAVAISFSPMKYQTQGNLLNLPYKLVFAVATLDTIIIYSSDDDFKPLGQVSNLHYQPITDLVWTQDGMRIISSSIDGFCSFVDFESGVFGEKYTGEPAQFVEPLKKKKGVDVSMDVSASTTDKVKNSENSAIERNASGKNATAQKEESTNKPVKTIDSFFNTDKKVTKKVKKRITPTLIQ
ncbi:CAC2 [Candida oxycetoniae]|uniref:CAC2 n=1 Tax=Candida oxycetoniae TaxID=497107 RepID=A0AAI9SUI0_9ASCO|nr:CAC2 [Candida oxycetoniae]KAI3403306.2 CAC2 [Candida oxycetoniae]